MNPSDVDLSHGKSYQAVVLSVVVATVVVVGGDVVVALISLSCRRRRSRASRNFLRRMRRVSGSMAKPPLPGTGRLLPLTCVFRDAPLLPWLSRRMGLLPCRAMIC